jgi:hypothetical protein
MIVRMGKTLLGCGFVLLSLVVGCGGKDDDDGVGIPLESMPARLGGTLCKLSYQCCTAAQREGNLFIGTTEAECKSNYQTILALGVPEINQSISKKRMRYDGNALASCLSRLESAGCNSTAADAVACDGVFIPLVPSGGACTAQGECVTGGCFGADATNDVDGMCGAPVANGTDCDDDQQCASGYCNGLSCEAKVPNGSACSTDAECESDECNTTTLVCETESGSVCE